VTWLSSGASLASRIQEAGGAGANHDYKLMGAGLGAAAADGVQLTVEASSRIKAKLAAKPVDGAPTYILDIATLVITLTDFLNGFSSPVDSTSITTASGNIKDAQSSLLNAVMKDQEWSGAAADSYNDSLSELQTQCKAVRDADAAFAAAVDSQRDAVATAHYTVNYCTIVLAACWLVAIALYYIPDVGPQLSMAFQTVAAIANVTAVSVMEIKALSNSTLAADSLGVASGSYAALNTTLTAKLSSVFNEQTFKNSLQPLPADGSSGSNSSGGTGSSGGTAGSSGSSAGSSGSAGTSGNTGIPGVPIPPGTPGGSGGTGASGGAGNSGAPGTPGTSGGSGSSQGSTAATTTGAATVTPATAPSPSTAAPPAAVTAPQTAATGTQGGLGAMVSRGSGSKSVTNNKSSKKDKAPQDPPLEEMQGEDAPATGAPEEQLVGAEGAGAGTSGAGVAPVAPVAAGTADGASTASGSDTLGAR